jgi:hypothetical protein
VTCSSTARNGLLPSLKASADETVRLSEFMRPHACVRVLPAEALFRAWSPAGRIACSRPWRPDSTHGEGLAVSTSRVTFAAWISHVERSEFGDSAIMGLPLFETAQLLRAAGFAW